MKPKRRSVAKPQLGTFVLSGKPSGYKTFQAAIKSPLHGFLVDAKGRARPLNAKQRRSVERQLARRR